MTTSARKPRRSDRPDRPRGVPVAVTALALLLGLFATVLGLLALVHPASALGHVSGADVLGTGWGGRNAGLGVVLLVAVLLRHPLGYVVAFAGQVPREVSDLVNALPDVGGVVLTVALLGVEVLALAVCLRTARRLDRAQPIPASASSTASPRPTLEWR